ncbi:MAG: type IV toxin-antitoxin system AbiEi family antitoxin domain-containing protein [Phycisphaerae bacterium]|nr:type IV toxin-antitoxin system AbiEi family antitoxin domain-containing protein [Phycisphaerae bacterium]
MNDKDKILEYATREGAISPRKIEEMGISRQLLYRLHQEGRLVRVARGTYSIPDIELTEYHTYAQVAATFPNSVICLLSSLQFHDLTTQMPHKVWVALNRDTDRRSRKPSRLPVSLVRFSGESFSEGIKIHNIEGVDVRIYSAAKTVADCFKYRNKIGLEIAIEALTDCIRKKKATRDQIWHFAKICRVSKVIRPYMEVII